MSNELNIALTTTGLTVTAQRYQAGAAVGAAITMTEVGSSAFYSGDMTGTAGTYQIVFLAGGATVGAGRIVWTGTAEVIVATETKQDTAQTTLTRLNGLVEDSTGDRFTAKALEQAPVGAGGGSTAEAIWSYATRSLTAGPGSEVAFGVYSDTIALRKILVQVAGKTGLRYEEQDAALVESWCFFAHDRIREFFTAYQWPDVCKLEQIATAAVADSPLRSVDVPGEVLKIYAVDPRAEQRTNELFYTKVSGSRAFLKGTGLPASVWVFYKQAAPDLAARVDDGATAYRTGDVVYFDAEGDCYRYGGDDPSAIGSTPTLHEALWTVAPVPQIAQRWMVHSIYSDWLRDQGEMEKAVAEERIARDKLEEKLEAEVANFGSGFSVSTR